MGAPLPAIERLSRELADFSKALRDEKGPVVSSSLVERVDVLNQRISQIEDSGQPVEALKIDMQELHQAVVGAVEPRFAALEDKIGALSGQFTCKQDDRLPDISAGELEKQIRLLADKMDQTSSELTGLQRLYSDQGATEPTPDIGEMAELVAKRTAEALEKAQEAEGAQNAAASSEAMAQLETRLSNLFDKSNSAGDQQGFPRVQDSIEQVNQRLERLEASLKNAAMQTDVEAGMEIAGPDTKTQPETEAEEEEEAEAEAEAEAADFPDSPSSATDAQLPFENQHQEETPLAPLNMIGEANDRMPKPPRSEEHTSELQSH